MSFHYIRMMYNVYCICMYNLLETENRMAYVFIYWVRGDFLQFRCCCTVLLCARSHPDAMLFVSLPFWWFVHIYFTVEMKNLFKFNEHHKHISNEKLEIKISSISISNEAHSSFNQLSKVAIICSIALICDTSRVENG